MPPIPITGTSSARATPRTRASVLSVQGSLASGCPALLDEVIEAYVLIENTALTDLSFVRDSERLRLAILFKSQQPPGFQAELSPAYIAAQDLEGTMTHLYLAIDCRETDCACQGLLSAGTLRFLVDE